MQITFEVEENFEFKRQINGQFYTNPYEKFEKGKIIKVDYPLDNFYKQLMNAGYIKVVDVIED